MNESDEAKAYYEAAEVEAACAELKRVVYEEAYAIRNHRGAVNRFNYPAYKVAREAYYEARETARNEQLFALLIVR